MNQPITTPKGEFLRRNLTFLLFFGIYHYVMITRDKLWQVKKKIKIMNHEKTAKILKIGEDMSKTTKIMVVQRYVYANSSDINKLTEIAPA